MTRSISSVTETARLTSGGPPRVRHALILIYYIPLMLILGSVSITEPVSPELKIVLVSVGAVAFWRYCWQGVHFLRAIYYLVRRFPRLRKAATALGDRDRLREIYVVITSFRIETAVTLAVYRALFNEALRYGAKTTIVAAITDPADEQLLRYLLDSLEGPHRVEILIMYQTGAGKRTAMAEALRAIARRMPGADAVVALMDGDVILESGIFAKCLPFFVLSPKLGALTVNNRAIANGSSGVGSWYALRFAQRHIYMSSASLSRRLLVLTGRFSLFRATIAADPDFIRAVDEDYVNHWRHGPIRLLTGDDKSTWLWVLQRGWEMLYVPDATVASVEHLPNRHFVTSSINLMHRWFGNMLRANMRALPMGPGRMGLFTWWCLVDQRISMWTSLVGPTLAIIGAVHVSWRAVPAYMAWVMATRLVQSGMISAVSGRFDGYYPILLYYNQLVGASVKIYVAFRVERQSWTRQGITTGTHSSSWSEFWHSAWSAYFQSVSVALLILLLCFYSGALSVPTPAFLRTMLQSSLAPPCGSMTVSCYRTANQIDRSRGYGHVFVQR